MADLLLGGRVDPATGQRTDERAVLAADDLTTHGVIVGMTGSGKTGLGVVLIEECLAADIPTLLIDPKGDLTNLCLMFPDLNGSDFRPWIEESDAARAGVSPDEYAEQQATLWRDGLAGWGLGPDQLRTWRDRVDTTIYTPGSSAGAPMNVVGSLQRPAEGSDEETIGAEITGYVSGLLGLVGIDADPLSSKEHILLANLIHHAWSNDQAIDLAGLVAQVQQPPLRKLGVFELDQFYPSADRTKLAVRLNGLLASPSFSAWGQGAPIDLDTMLRTTDGRARCAIVTTAHLNDEERQFVTTLVLSKLITWMRRQSGTSRLRTLLYMDEVAGYLPPTANPPTKPPIMTLMKQARAFGVGVVLSTQNPVDIDYKAISNAGTWMIGRLQTDRDKQRLLDGMSAAAGGVDVAAIGDTISGLGKRQFVLRRAGKDQPELFTTRWAMSYLRGPLTRDQIASLTAQRPPSPTAGPAAAPTVGPAAPDGSVAPGAPAATLDHDETPVCPEVAAGTPVSYLDPAAPWSGVVGARPGTRFEAAVTARVMVRYEDARAGVSHEEEYEAVLFPVVEHPDAASAIAVDHDERDFRSEPPAGATYVLPDAPLTRATWWRGLERGFVDHLYRTEAVEVFTNRDLKLWSRVGEDEASFRQRCERAGDDAADADVAKLHDKYQARLRRLETQVQTAANQADVLETQAKGRATEELLGAAGSLLGGFLGGRRNTRAITGAMGTAAGRRTRTSTTQQRAQAAKQKVGDLQSQIMELEAELQDEVAEITERWDQKAAAVGTVSISPRKTAIRVTDLRLVWMPVG